MDNNYNEPVDSGFSGDAYYTENPAPQPEPMPVEKTLLAKIEEAYQGVQARQGDIQQQIQEKREHVAAIRARMRELAAEAQFDEYNDENELHNSKVSIQNDNCNALIGHAEQIREHIYHNAAHAETLLTPLRANVDLLALRVQHIRAIEKLLEQVREGITAQEQLSDIDAAINALADKLNVS